MPSAAEYIVRLYLDFGCPDHLAPLAEVCWLTDEKENPCTQVLRMGGTRDYPPIAARE
jgi:hypothetical protein